MGDEYIAKTGYWNSETDSTQHRHSPKLSEWICNFLKDKKRTTIYDFGCGLGNYLKDLSDFGYTDLIGFEGDPHQNKVFDKIEKMDLTAPFQVAPGHVICLEVGEHIPKEYMEPFLNNIKNSCSDYLIMSWAVRLQTGHGHVNCLDNEEIIPIIERMGFVYLESDSMQARDTQSRYWFDTPWFKDTILIFQRK